MTDEADAAVFSAPDETDFSNHPAMVPIEASRSPGEVVRSPGLPWDGLSEFTMSGVGSVTFRQTDRSAFNASVDRLAKRLGVEPHTARDPFDALATFVVNGEDGRSYAVFDLTHAMLDRLDAASGGEG